MRTETETQLASFSDVPWFQNVGVKKSDNVKAASSWREAMSYCKQLQWASVQLQVNNVLGICVNRTDYERYLQWNRLVNEIDETLNRIIEAQILPISRRFQLPKLFRDSVHWDLMEICLETEFSDICEPILFLERVLPWYQAGHFPCGWDGPKLDESWGGPMPEGRLIVY